MLKILRKKVVCDGILSTCTSILAANATVINKLDALKYSTTFHLGWGKMLHLMTIVTEIAS